MWIDVLIFFTITGLHIVSLAHAKHLHNKALDECHQRMNKMCKIIAFLDREIVELKKK